MKSNLLIRLSSFLMFNVAQNNAASTNRIEIPEPSPSVAIPESFMRVITQEKPPFSIFGKTVYLRTYSRKINGENNVERRETWAEIVKRVVEYSFTLHIGPVTPEIQNEALALYETIYRLKGFTSGRTLWVGGTDYVNPNNPKGSQLSSYNCSFTRVDTPEDLYEIVFLLMNGAGVGFSATQESVDSLTECAPIGRTPQIEISPYGYTPPLSDKEQEVLDHNFYSYADGILTLDIGDSREGWAMFLRDFTTAMLTGSAKYTFDALTRDASSMNHNRTIHMTDNGQYNENHIDIIRVVSDRVRPNGTPLKSFGGTASGPDPLLDYIHDLSKIIQEDSITAWSDVLINDIVTMIGRAVVSGGSRRSALISCGDADSDEFAAMKTGDWYSEYPWRSQANNSQYYYEKPAREQLLKRLNQALIGDPANGIYPAGEPGMFNMETARKRRGDVQGFNPCGK